MRTTLLLLVALVSPAFALDGFLTRDIAGWQVLLDPGYQQGGDTERAAFDTVLNEQVDRLGRLPAAPRERLRTAVKIYVSSATHRKFGAQHHPSPEWLAQNGYPAEFAGNVEICNWREFTGLVKSQPFCLLHEMSHAFHFLTSSADPLIKSAYEHAKDAGLYQQVTRGHTQVLVEAYARKNHHEYFAELCEAYFGENDFAPYERKELAAYDPDGLRMIEQVWGLPGTGSQP